MMRWNGHNYLDAPGRVRIQFGMLFLGCLFILTACGGSDLESELAEQAERIEELEQELAEAKTTTTTAPTTTTILTTTTAAPTTTVVEVRDVTVTFHLIDDQHFQRGDEGCEGVGGYSDISPRTQMVVEDEAGQRLAATQLGRGSVFNAGDLSTDYGASFCRFRFTFTDVPTDRQLYTVSSGRRGSVTYEPTDFLYGTALMSLGP